MLPRANPICKLIDSPRKMLRVHFLRQIALPNVPIMALMLDLLFFSLHWIFRCRHKSYHIFESGDNHGKQSKMHKNFARHVRNVIIVQNLMSMMCA